MDPRIEAFLSDKAPNVFYGVITKTEIGDPDPFDVPSIHGPAREAFADMLAAAVHQTLPGRFFLVLGEGGVGKTHLARQIRRHTHENGLGFFGYMQMTSPAEDYGQYILSNLIDSLDSPYFPGEETTGLMKLSNALVQGPWLAKAKIKRDNRRTSLARAFQEWTDLPPEAVAKLIEYAMRHVVADPAFKHIALDVLIALIYMQVQDPMVNRLAVTYLRTRRLPPALRDQAPALIGYGDSHNPLQNAAELAKVMWAVLGRRLVFCLDQLEDARFLEDPETQIKRALSALSALAGEAPSSIMVVSCLDEYFESVKNGLPGPLHDRLTYPPNPQRLVGRIDSVADLHGLVGQRLAYLFEQAGVEYNPAEPVFPLPAAELEEKCLGLRMRNILELCAAFRDQARQTGRIPERLPANGGVIVVADLLEDVERDWQRHLNAFDPALPESDQQLATVLARGLDYCGLELEAPNSRAWFDGPYVLTNGDFEPLCIGLVNQVPSFGHLSNALTALEERAGDRRAVMVRNTEFPRTGSQTAGLVGEMIGRGARRVVMHDTEWRAVTAMPSFFLRHHKRQGFDEWRRRYRPLTRYDGIKRIFGLESGPEPPPPKKKKGAVTPPAKPRKKTAPKPRPATERLIAGFTDDQKAAEVYIETRDLIRHAAFLGGTGSGKTVAAMNLVEQLLLAGVPVILVDRKGDLASYADPDAWAAPAPDPDLQKRKDELKKRVDVRLYTPGHPNGNPLGVGLAPDGSNLLPDYERMNMAAYAAGAMSQVMGLKSSPNDQACFAILKQAVYLLTEINDPEEVTLQEVIDLVAERDANLLNLVGNLKPRLFDRLVTSLETLRLTRGELLDPNLTRMSAEGLFGLGGHAVPGKARLSVISTKFLGDALNADFFVTQLLMELMRHISKNPADRLQGAVVFDEADLYLPAVRKPASKGPMEDLLKRGRSGGLSVFLATQSPGDLDYRCKENVLSWYLGDISQDTALNKIKAMLPAKIKDLTQRLPGQAAGRFHLLKGSQATRIRSLRSAIELKQLPEDRILALAAGVPE